MLVSWMLVSWQVGKLDEGKLILSGGSSRIWMKVVRWWRVVVDKGSNDIVDVCCISFDIGMNFHRKSGQGKGLEGLKEVTAGGKDEKELYESMFAKHFQIIQTFLEKINELYNKNQDLENSLCTIEDKVEKLEASTKNIHYEFRTTHLMIDKKLNTINTDSNSLQEQLQLLQLDNNRSFLPRTGPRNSNFKKKKKTRRNAEQIEAYNISVLSSNDLSSAVDSRQGNLMRSDSISPKLPTEESDKTSAKGLNLTSSGCEKVKLRNSLEGCSSSSSININASGKANTSMKMFQEGREDQDEESQKWEGSSWDNRGEGGDAGDGGDGREGEASGEWQGCDEDWVQAEIAKEIAVISQKMQEQLQLSNTQHSQLKEELGKMVTQPHLDSCQERILSGLAGKLAELKAQFQTSLSVFREEVGIANQKQMEEYFESEKKSATSKVELGFFEDSMNSLAASINESLAKHERHFANKVQTKRAVEFLEGKINKLIKDEASNFKSKKHLANEDPCLKINKCESAKKIDANSERSIRADGHYRSLETSMNYIEIDKQGKEEKKVRRVASQVITWKKHASAEFIQKEPQLVKNFSKSRQHQEHVIHKRLSVEDPKVNLKEWREKVVRVLRKEDRRKRKVTFR